jgi:hypothetical protein
MTDRNRPRADRASATDGDEDREALADLRRRVHVDVPRIRPQDMVTSQEADAPQDPTRGHDVEAEFLVRHVPGV